jgi:hypothetical protein
VAGEAHLELGLEGVEQLGPGDEAVGLDAVAQVVEEVLGRIHTDIGADERLLELVPGLLVDLRAPGDRPDVARQQAPRLGEAVAEPGLDDLGGLDHLGFGDDRLGLGDDLAVGVDPDDVGLGGIDPDQLVGTERPRLDRGGAGRALPGLGGRLEHGRVAPPAPHEGEAGDDEHAEDGDDDEEDDGFHGRTSLLRPCRRIGGPDQRRRRQSVRVPSVTSMLTVSPSRSTSTVTASPGE